MKQQVIDYFKKERSRRWHRVTSLGQCNGKAYYTATGVVPRITEQDVLRLVIGRIGHEILEIFPVKEITLEKDGITGHADILWGRYAEIKITWLGSKRPVDYVESWFRQIKSYAYMAGVYEYDLMTLHIMGNYKKPIGPQLKVSTLRFNEDELKANWLVRLKKDKIITEAVETKVLPILDPDDTECERCQYAYYCLGDVVKEVTGEVREDVRNSFV